MKKLFLISIFSFCLVAAKAQATGDIVRIEFSTSTRGYQKQHVITRNNMTVSEESRTETKDPVIKKISGEDWNTLMHSLSDVPLAELPQLRSPTMKRASDAARASVVTIITADGRSWSHEFDNENPHARLQTLVKTILLLEQR